MDKLMYYNTEILHSVSNLKFAKDSPTAEGTGGATGHVGAYQI